MCDFSQDTDQNAPGRPELWLEPWIDRLAAAFVGGTIQFREPLRELSRRTKALVVLTAGAAWRLGKFRPFELHAGAQAGGGPGAAP